jgi:hypothetical protein
MRCKPLLVLAIFTLLSFHLVLIGCGDTGRSSVFNLSTRPASTPSPPGASSSQPGNGSLGGGPMSGGGSSGSEGGPGSTGGTAQSGFTETKSPISAAGQMLAADFNHDGRPDLLIYGSSLAISLNNSAGDFSAPIPVSLPASYSLVTQVGLADFNRDGYTDVAACVNKTAPAARLPSFSMTIPEN